MTSPLEAMVLQASRRLIETIKSQAKTPGEANAMKNWLAIALFRTMLASLRGAAPAIIESALRDINRDLAPTGFKIERRPTGAATR